MRVLLLCWRDVGHPEGGGSEVYLERVAEYLADPAHGGHDVTVRTARYPGAARTERRSGVTYVRGGGKITVYTTAWWYMLRHRFGPASGRFDVAVDTQNGMPFFARIFAGMFGGARTILLTHHCHREQWPDAGPVVSRVGWFVESRLSPLVNRDVPYVTVSDSSRRELEDLGVDPGRIRIIHNGVDVPEELQAGRTLPPRPEVTPGGAPHLVTLSRLTPLKQIEHAVDALAGILPAYPGAVLDIVGDGWWADNLHRYVADRGLGDHVVFHGHVDGDDKQRLLAGAALHLMPSRKEGWGLAVIEAGLHGVPTVGYSTSAGLRDSVVAGETGVLVDDRDAFTAAVRELLDNDGLRRRLGEAARTRALGFSWDATGAAWRDLIEHR